MTIHKSIVLEFKCVFLISLNDGIIPYNLKDNNLLEQERKVLYLGIAREKNIFIIS